mmetsp:Transcript_11883/g.25324  ORF Transcript_11883/g.25324 Transcript_11883/m.25324 type:complete len:590 (-) Transcript_11883:322-2091(-)
MSTELKLRDPQTNLEYHFLSTPAHYSSKEENGNGEIGQIKNPIVGSASKSMPTTRSQTGHKKFGGSMAQAVMLKIMNLSNKSQKLCRDLFLPIDYPKSVADGYLEYQFYDSLQGLCSYLRGVVATSAVLSATGVGDADATAMSAAMTWAVRDGLGMIGGLLFSYVASPHFDAYVKEFRLLADVLNDVAMTLDMALPLILTWSSSFSPTYFGPWYSTLSLYLPSLYLVLTSTSTLCKVACGMAAGATKGNITDHFAITGNRADCQAKESTQETLVSLIGMCFGVWLGKVLHKLEKAGNDSETCVVSQMTDACDNNPAKTTAVDVQLISWTIFITLTFIHVYANYVGMQMLRLRTLNRERAKVALQSVVKDCSLWVLEDQMGNDGNSCEANEDESISQKNEKRPTSKENTSKRLILDKASSRLLSPKSVSESLLKSMYGMVVPRNIHLGIHLKDLVLRFSSSKYQKTISESFWGQWAGENYIIFIDRDKKNKCAVTVVLRESASNRDELKAFVHAQILEWSMEHDPHLQKTMLANLFSRSYQMIQHLFQSSAIDGKLSDRAIDLYNILDEKGWDMKRLYLGFGPHRCEWDD